MLERRTWTKNETDEVLFVLLNMLDRCTMYTPFIYLPMYPWLHLPFTDVSMAP